MFVLPVFHEKTLYVFGGINDGKSEECPPSAEMLRLDSTVNATFTQLPDLPKGNK